MFTIKHLPKHSVRDRVTNCQGINLRGRLHTNSVTTHWLSSLSFSSWPMCHRTRSDKMAPMSLVAPGRGGGEGRGEERGERVILCLHPEQSQGMQFRLGG